MHRKMAEHRRANRMPKNVDAKMQLEHKKYKLFGPRKKMGVVTIISTANDHDNGCSNLPSIQPYVNTWAFQI